MVRAAGAKPVWMTLQIAWSGVAPSKQRPGVVPRFPTLQAERFMAYQAIVSGARGLVFFGGHLVQVAAPSDAAAGWNWTFWNEVLRPLVVELTSAAVAPALVAPNARQQGRSFQSDGPPRPGSVPGFWFSSSVCVFLLRRVGGRSVRNAAGTPRGRSLRRLRPPTLRSERGTDRAR